MSKWVRIALVLGIAGLSATARAEERRFELKAESPGFWKVVAHHAKLVPMGHGFGFTEGPVWDLAGFLYLSDENINKIFRLFPDGHREEVISLGDPDGNTFDREHRLLDCASVLRAVIRLEPGGSYTVLADRFEGKRFNSPNDVVLGPDGAIYFTDPTLDLPAGQKQETPYQGVYRLDDQGNVSLLTRDLAQPNGLAFSPDGRRLFIDDSERSNIRVYDFLPGGRLANGRVFGEEPGGPHDGVPDGMRADRAGHLLVTGPGGIWVWSLDGRHLGTILLPEQPANFTWGDRDYRTLYITATTSVYRLRTRVHGFVPYLPFKHP